MSETVVVTGATGLLGGNLAEALRAEGLGVRCTRRRSSGVEHLAHLDLEWVEADVGDRGALTAAFRGAAAVFHCAAAVSIARRVTPVLQATNVVGTENVIAAARAAGVGRLVHCSSTVTVGLSVDGITPVDEGAAFNFEAFGLADGYVRTKRAAEERVLASGLDVVVVNPGFMFGPYDVRPSSGRMVVDVVKRRVPGVSGGWNNFASARRVADGLVAAWRRGRGGERYILGGENRSYAEMFRRIAEMAGVPAPTRVVPRWLAVIAGAVGDVQARVTGREPLISGNAVAWGYSPRFISSSAKAIRELGYDPGSPDDGVRQALEWFRETGRL